MVVVMVVMVVVVVVMVIILMVMVMMMMMIANGKTDYSGLNGSRQFPECNLLLSFPCKQF